MRRSAKTMATVCQSSSTTAASENARPSPANARLVSRGGRAPGRFPFALNYVGELRPALRLPGSL